MIPTNDPINEGITAAYAEERRGTNPYKSGPEREGWFYGYDQAAHEICEDRGAAA